LKAGTTTEILGFMAGGPSLSEPVGVETSGVLERAGGRDMTAVMPRMGSGR
jgi:hypothetical protein